MASKPSASKGKRYSAAEKKEIIDFVDQVNTEKGRGGQSAASKKFGISPLTISSWLKKGAGAEGAAKAGRKTPKKAARQGGRRASVLDQLASLDAEIRQRRIEIDDLEAKFQKLKDSL